MPGDDLRGGKLAGPVLHVIVVPDQVVGRPETESFRLFATGRDDRIRFWPKTGSGALHVKLREIF